jgi:tetratricopeptide (TPR) repeat protein
VAARYDTSAHHFHPRGSAGAACAACHLPDTTYMQIDPRHDHSIRVPRPDLSVRLGVPNACNRCHTDRDARWALQVVTTHFGHAPSGFQRFAEAFAADDRAEAGATAALGAVAIDPTEPAFVRASALTRLAARPGAVALDAARRAARDASPLVRRGALDILDAYPAAERLAIATPLLADTTRIVRLKAAWVLAPVADSLAPAARPAFARAAAEFVASQRYNADRASSRLTLGAFDAARGRLDSAAAEFRAAVHIDPLGAQGYINLAAVLLAQHRAVEAERLLRDALTKIPDDAELRRVHGEVLGSLGRLH